MKNLFLKIVVLLSSVMMILLIFSIIQVEIMDGVRAYIRGESAYSRSQKNSSFYLLQYLKYGNKEDLKLAENEINIALGDKLAREAILKNDTADYEKAYQGFLQANNHPEDIYKMIVLLDYFRNFPYIKESIEHWSKGDALNEKLKNIILELKNKTADDHTILFDLYNERIKTIHEKLEYHEYHFSSSLSEGTRFIKSLLELVAFLLFAVSISVAFLMLRRTIKNLEAQEMQNWLLSTSLDSIHDAAYMGDKEGKLVYVNHAATKDLGYTKDELLEMNVMDVDAPDFRIPWENIWNMMLEQKSANIEVAHQRKDGSIFPVEVSISLIEFNNNKYILGIAQDITERKKIQQELEHYKEHLEEEVENRTLELQEHQKFLQTLYDSTNAIIATITPEGTMNSINKYGENFTGYTQEEIASKPYFWFDNFLPGSEKPDIQALLENMKSSKNVITKKQNPWIYRDGTLKMIEWSNSVVLDANRDIEYLITVGIDISKEAAIKEELIAAKEQAEKAANAKSEFLANMSHEIRTPMNSVIGMTDLALETDLDVKQRNYVDKANIAAKNLLGIINDILDFSKLEAGKFALSPVHFELKDVIGDTFHLIGIAAKDKDISTRIKIDPKVPKIYHADSLRLGQVLTNLTANAVKFSHKRGVVTVEIDLLEESDTHALVQFSVIDEGIGIAQETQEKLFQSFSQADGSTQREFGGTGLGLAISKQIVDLMDGEIWLESKEGEGSSFRFKVHLEKSNKENIAKTTQDTKKAMKLAIEKLQNKKVLLVEDNEMNQELALDLLSKNNIKVSLANNGLEALDILEQEIFDIVLMDVQMPVMDGYEATKQIRAQERFKDLPVIAMTANVMVDDVEQAKVVGMDNHIGKPIVPSEMFVTMAKYVEVNH